MKLSQELIDKIKEVACEKFNERVEVDFCIKNAIIEELRYDKIS